MREIDLSEYKIRTDLVSDLVSDDKKIKESIYEKYNIKVSKITLNEKDSLSLEKEKGDYITIYFNDITDHDNYSKLKEVFSLELGKMLSSYNKENVLIIGLGNRKSTCDALGPRVIDIVKSTRHIYEIYKSLESGFVITSKIAPGVMGETGIETSDIISGIISFVKPTLILVVDSLASSSIDRVVKTIQITNAGISPGSGIGNNRNSINYETYGVPVIAIGVPTVVDASTIVFDTINFMAKHFSYNLENKDLASKLIPSSINNYLKKDLRELNTEEKSYFLGAFGLLSNFEKKALINDVLTPIGYNLMVTPKEIDFDILNLSTLIGDGINASLHSALNDNM